MNELEIRALIRELFLELCEHASGKCPFKGANSTNQVDLYINAVVEKYLKQREWSMSDIVILAKHLSTALNPAIDAAVEPLKTEDKALAKLIDDLGLRVNDLETETTKIGFKTKVIWSVIGIIGAAGVILAKDLIFHYLK